MQVVGRGRIVLWQGGSLWLMDANPDGSRERTAMHAHHAIQVTFSLGGTFTFESPSGRIDGPGVAIAPDADHIFEARGRIALVFIEPESRAGRAVAGTLFAEQPLVQFDPRVFRAIGARLKDFESLDDTDLVAIGQDAIATLSGGVPAESMDWRLRKVIGWATSHLDEPITAAQAAKEIDLSSGRFSHLFVEQTGLPFRTYVLWLRLMRAVELFAAGTALTEAAHTAGFSDSAHFSRTFHRMFGLPATALQVR